ncbi:LysE family translocator [Rhodobacteraceae bacterium HSP-20]|uniref:LysE family translocator n=1 Tax=Paragemmobacter amnigenus TaxID=2852097 RepID=A0ABS6IZX5_9RHOB|nr:LysE family translocator [Rhodobacter amnigenus]MBU9697054.1 LysE family translocator [Rhodobacter amnigenus]MBV4388281.1 LysE family translocator [Rhodobacter amnigenus]
MFPVDPWVLLAFIPAGLALNLTPGADMMFTLAQGLKGGPRAGMAANAGIAVGGMVHTVIAGLGLGALVAAHPVAFDVIRWGGVAYLLWLAVQSLRAGPMAARGDVAARSLGRVFVDGLMVNLLNPKVILFILAFLPQFVDPSRAVLPQFLVLGLVFSLGGFVVNGVVAVFAGGAGQRLAGSAVFARWLGRVGAVIFAGLAVRLALMSKG